MVYKGLRWCSGQTTRLSPLRFQVRSPVRFTLMWTRTQSSCEKSIYSQRSAESRVFSSGTPVSSGGLGLRAIRLSVTV